MLLLLLLLLLLLVVVNDFVMKHAFNVDLYPLVCRIWCRKHSFIYQSLSISTVADPLSADLIKCRCVF